MKCLTKLLRALKLLLIFPAIILVTFLVLSGSKDWAQKVMRFMEA